MIGPGTGVAPFRAYMQEREEHGFKGNTWLFFGDQHFTTDFLYQTEWQEWLKDGVLGKWMLHSQETLVKKYTSNIVLLNTVKNLMNGFKRCFIYICGDENIWRKMYIKLSAMF